MTRTLKWRGLGPSEYVSHCGTYLVGLAGRTWHLYRRVALDRDSASNGPSWTWSPSLFHHSRKGPCQDFAEGSPRAPSPGEPNSPEKAPGRHGDRPQPQAGSTAAPQGRPGLSWWETGPSGPEHNARCYHCGVPFNRDAKSRRGDFCSQSCRDTTAEILEAR